MTSKQSTPAGATEAKVFSVHVDGAGHGAFRNMRDAIEAAKIVKRERPQALVSVRDDSTGQVVGVDS